MLSRPMNYALLTLFVVCLFGCSSTGTFAPVAAPAPVPALTISPIPPAVISPGQTITFQLMLGGNPVSTAAWALNPGANDFGSLNPTGTYTAPAALDAASLGKTVSISATNTQANTQASVSFILGYPAPTLSSATPSQVKTAATTQVTLSGTHLSNVSNVSINGASVSASIVSDTQITLSYVTAPWSTGDLAVTVTAPGPGGGTSAPLTIPITQPLATYDSASRFLTQAAWGPTDASIAQVQAIGLSAYIDQQLAADVDYFWTDDDTGHEAQDLFLWAQLHDYSQLRTKMAWIWWKLYNTPLTTVGWTNTSVPDTCNRDAFGSFETLLKDVSFNPVMGLTLTYDLLDYPTASPNQNFGRESMQLFSIGPVLLNADGSPQLDANGAQIPAYTQADVQDISRAVTGFVHPPDWNTGDDPHGLVPLQSSDSFPHDELAKTVLSTPIPANQTATQDLTAVVHILASHPNVAPFMSKYLIHELVTSNPSPAYVSRITSVWNDDGKGNRGNIAAVVKAILLDPEARAGDVPSGLTNDEGRFRDPVGWETFVFRATRDNAGEFSSLGMNTVFGTESIWASPDIFSYYQQFTTLPNSDLLAPEYQLYTPLTIQSRAWFLYDIVYLPPTIAPIVSNFDWDYWGSLVSGDGTQFIDYMNHLVFHGTMSTDLRSVLISDAQNDSNLTTRAQQMMLDVFLSPEAAIQR